MQRAELSAAADVTDQGVIETVSGSRYILVGPPLQTLVGENGTTPPTTTAEGGRSGQVYSAKDGSVDGDETECSCVECTEHGGQIVYTEGGSRYRVFPSRGPDEVIVDDVIVAGDLRDWAYYTDNTYVASSRSLSPTNRSCTPARCLLPRRWPTALTTNLNSHLPFRSFQSRWHVAVISFTGWVYNKVGTPDGDWIKTGKKAQDLPNDVNGNRMIETESGSVYRLVGPCLPGIKDWCKITNGPLRNQYVGSVCYKDGAED